MTEDHYKGIVTAYNHLVLPVYIAKGADSILMTYDAGGTLLRKQHKSGSTVVMTRDYIGGMEYINDTLDAIYHSEGRIKYINEVARYEYYIRDHLGNIRLTYSDLNADGLITTPDEIIEEMHYYPYGMMMTGTWMGSSGQYGYNGIEYENFLDLEMNLATYRGLDPTLGRWGQVDPKAEALYGLSPYNSMGNNPVRNVDPNGDLFFAIPQISFNGGFSIGIEVGFGVPGVKSISATGMVGSQNSWSVQGRAFGFYAGYGSGGAFAGVGSPQWNGLSVGYEFVSGTASLGYGSSFGNMNNASVGLSYGKGGFGFNAGASSTLMWGEVHPGYTAEQQEGELLTGDKVRGLVGIFEDETLAYKWMLVETLFYGVEVSAWLTENGVLIAPIEFPGPEGKNTVGASSNRFFSTSIRGKTRYAHYNGQAHKILGQVHTHPRRDDGLGSHDQSLSKWIGYGAVHTIGPKFVHRGYFTNGNFHHHLLGLTANLLNGKLTLLK